ncbi:MAG: LysR family transcriptional regulator [Gammaproteobacteria bacterium]|nr:LysR family transcriptional regulator [Gammaproteobacteria bacterium]
MNKFEDIQAFVAVVEAGSFTAAAERLQADKSAISRRVAALEDRLGTQLLRRTTRALTITDTGNSFYQHASRILADLDEAETAVAQQHGELQGRIRVSLPLSFGVHHLRCPIADFNKAHPGVQMDLDLSDRYVDLLQEGFDVAVRIGKLDDSSLVARRLFESRLVICASPDYIATHGEPGKPEELSKHQCVVYSGTADPASWTFIHSDGEQQRVRVNPVMSANSGEMLLEAAADGLGITLQPTFLACSYIKSGKLVPILTDYQLPVGTGYAVYPPTRHLSYRVRAFIDFLVEHFSGVPSWDCY